MAHQYTGMYFPSALEVSFNRLVKKDTETLNQICSFAGVSIDSFEEKKENTLKQKSSNNYTKLNPEELEAVLKELPFLRDIQ